MSEHTSSNRSLREKAVEEFKEFVALSIYLGAVLLFKSAVLQGVGITFTIWGIAAIKAMVLAKFMLIGRMLQVGQRYHDKPLVWPTLHYALMSLIVLLVLTTIEEVIVGFIHSRALGDSLNHVVGPIFFQGIAVCFIMFLILVPYSAFTCLGDVLGKRELFRLFFVDRTVNLSGGGRLAG
jgi:hypothetical protein